MQRGSTQTYKEKYALALSIVVASSLRTGVPGPFIGDSCTTDCGTFIPPSNPPARPVLSAHIPSLSLPPSLSSSLRDTSNLSSLPTSLLPFLPVVSFFPSFPPFVRPSLPAIQLSASLRYPIAIPPRRIDPFFPLSLPNSLLPFRPRARPHLPSCACPPHHSLLSPLRAHLPPSAPRPCPSRQELPDEKSFKSPTY